MRRVFICLFAVVAILGAVDLDGRIGMGLGFSPDTYVEGGTLGLPVIDIAVTRIGLGPKLAVEPILQFGLEGDGSTVIDFALAGLGNFLLKGHSKTNLYGKAGLGFMLHSPGGGADSKFGFNLPFGFGLEHFVSEHFSVNLAALSGFTFISHPAPGQDTYMEVKLGNAKPFAFYVLWYY